MLLTSAKAGKMRVMRVVAVGVALLERGPERVWDRERMPSKTVGKLGTGGTGWKVLGLFQTWLLVQ